jgi:hypothetical protein
VTTTTAEVVKPVAFGLFKPAENRQAFMKIGIQGFPGSGKTYTAALIAKGIYESLKNPKPVAFIDTESGSDFLVPKFKEWNIPFVVVKTRAFVDLVVGVRQAEAHASVVIIDSISHFWKEIQDGYKKSKVVEALKKKNKSEKEIEEGFAAGKFKPVSKLTMYDWGPIKDQWATYTELYMKGHVHIVMCGRASWEYENAEDEDGNKTIEKVGTKMTVEKDLGYEPNLLLEMVKEKRDNRDGRIEAKLWDHVCYVLKDKSTLLEGKTFVDPTFEAFRPHFNYLNIGGDHVSIESTKDSSGVFAKDSNDNVHEMRKKREILVEEIEGELMSGFPGQSADEKKTRTDLIFEVFGTRAFAALAEMYPENLKAGLDKLRVRIQEVKAQKTVKDGGK